MPSIAACIIYDTPTAARQQLRDRFGVSIETFIKAAQAGFIERANASPFDPVIAPGLDAWRYPVRSVRGDLEVLGEWRSDDPSSLPLSINDERQVIITVSSGDAATGISAKKPKSKNPKGALFEAAVERNTFQGDLFPELLTEARAKYFHTLTYPVWLFLLHINDDEIRAELSLPRSLDNTDHVSDYLVRIIIDVPLPDGAAERVPDEDDDDEILPVVTTKF